MRPNTIAAVTIVLALAAALPVLAGSGCGPKASKADAASKDIVETAVEAGNFATLAAALEAAGLSEVLKADGPYTVFAPTDEAFAKLPAGTVEALMQDIPRLKAVLLYHVVPGKVMAEQVGSMSTARSAQGSNLTIKADEDGVAVDNARVIQADIVASNGVIHVIDAVVIPAG